MSEEAGLVLRWATVVLVAFVLQIGVLVDLQPFGVHADAMLLLAICAGLAGGPARGAVVGFTAGLLADVMMPGTMGISALAYAVVGFGVGVGFGVVAEAAAAMHQRFVVVGREEESAGFLVGEMLEHHLDELSGPGESICIPAGF